MRKFQPTVTDLEMRLAPTDLVVAVPYQPAYYLDPSLQNPTPPPAPTPPVPGPVPPDPWLPPGPSPVPPSGPPLTLQD